MGRRSRPVCDNDILQYSRKFWDNYFLGLVVWKSHPQYGEKHLTAILQPVCVIGVYCCSSLLWIVVDLVETKLVSEIDQAQQVVVHVDDGGCEHAGIVHQ